MPTGGVPNLMFLIQMYLLKHGSKVTKILHVNYAGNYTNY